MAFATLLDNRGFISIKRLFWLLVLGAIVYGGFIAVPPFFNYWMMQYEVKSIAQSATFYKDEEIRNNILDKARYWAIPVVEEDIKIKRGFEYIEVSFPYDIKLDFFNRYRKTLHFEIYEKKPLAEIPRQ
ncbi:MAG: hypothetical protein HY883_01425 [Deltaproteobacteria bacterium]|nr:hypothetical protein [Deltaproteobacteria bacterium]